MKDASSLININNLLLFEYQDGKFYMMHDDLLKRTTDIASRYPHLANVPMRRLDSSIVDSLNAGEW